MSIQRTLTILAGAAALLQASAAPAEDLFRATFTATGVAFNPTAGRIVPVRLTERDIIAQATGIPATNRGANNGFALAYNATVDSLQVVDSNAVPIVDVIHFAGGTAISDTRQEDRFTLMFFPGQTNEFGFETNAFGTAVISERASRRGGSTNGVDRVNINGRVQFVLTGGNSLGTTSVSIASGNSSGGTNTSSINVGPNPGFFMTSPNIVFDATAQIFTGSFTATRRFPFTTGGTTLTTVSGTNGVGTSTNAVGTGTNGASTNGTTGTTGTIGTGTTGTGTTATTSTTGTGAVGVGAGAGTSIATGVGTGIGTTAGTFDTGAGTLVATAPGTSIGLPVTASPVFNTGLETTSLFGLGTPPITAGGVPLATGNLGPGTIITTGNGLTSIIGPSSSTVVPGTAILGTTGTLGTGTLGTGTLGTGTLGTGTLGTGTVLNTTMSTFPDNSVFNGSSM